MAKQFHHLANVFSRNLRLLVDIIVGLILTRLIVRQLGLDVFGLIAFVLSITALVDLLGNAISDAAARYVTQCVARSDTDGAERYMINTLAAVGLLGISSIVLVSGALLVVPRMSEAIPFGYWLVILVSICLASLGGVMSTGNFVQERFVSRECINGGARIAYGLVGAVLLLFTSIGMWAVAVAIFVAAIVRVWGFWFSFHRLMPYIQLQLSSIRWHKIIEVGTFVGWMLLAYCGTYLIRSGSITMVKVLAPESLGRYALVILVANMVLQVLTSLGLMTSPTTYRALARGNFRVATAQVERFLFLSAMGSITITIMLLFESDGIMNLWLGNSAPQNITPLLVVATVAACFSSLNVPISVYLAGCSRVRDYGLATIVEGGIIVVSIFGLLRWQSNYGIFWVAALPGITSILKNCIVFPLWHNQIFIWAPVMVFVRKGVVLASYSLITWLCWKVVKNEVNNAGVLGLALRMWVLCLPMASYAAYRQLMSWRRTSQALPNAIESVGSAGRRNGF